MTGFSRRQFLAGISFATAVTAFNFPARALSLATSAPLDHFLIVGCEGNSICAINLGTRKIHTVPLGFHPHGFAQHPIHPQRIWAIEKWGPNAAEIDFGAKTVTRKMTSPQGTGYFGHGLFLPKSDVLYIVQTNLMTGIGHLIGYETTNFQPVRDHEIAPCALHDCHLLPDGSFMVISHGSTMLLGPNGTHDYKPMVENASLVRFDPAQDKVVDRKFIEDKDQVLGHFALTTDGRIVAMSLPRPESDPSLPSNGPSTRGGAVYFGHVDQPDLKRIAIPADIDKNLRGEVLSIAVNEVANIAIVTNPESKTLMLIDIKDGAYIGSLQSDSNGISYDEALGGFFCSGSALNFLDEKAKDPKPFAVTTEKDTPYTAGFSGAHSVIVRMVGV